MKLVVSSYNQDEHACTLFEVNQETLQVQALDAKTLMAPSFIIEGDGYLYTYTKQPLQMISYQVVQEQLVEIDRFSLPGMTLTHLVYSPKHKRLFAASYADGAYCSLDVKQGKFSHLHYQKQAPDAPLSQCHCVSLSEDEERVYVTNIALDTIFVYDMDWHQIDEIHLPKGCGPRHTIVYEGYLYTITEYSNEVLVIDETKREVQQIISTTQGYAGNTYGATVLIQNHYLFASNRGLDTIARYKIEHHRLVYQEMMPTYGKHSRHMILSKDQTCIISFNKNSHTITYLDITTGKCILTIPYANVSCGVEY